MGYIVGFVIASLILGYIAIAVIKLCIKLLPLVLIGGACCLGLIILASAIDDSSSSSDRIREIVNAKYNTANTRNALNNAHKSFNNVRTKAGVNLSTLQPAMESAIDDIVEAFQMVLGDDYIPTITSGDDFDGHLEGSAHYSGAALDFRLKDIDSPYMREMVTVAVREALGDRFFVDHEFPDEENEHLHVQMRRGTYNKYAAR